MKNIIVGKVKGVQVVTVENERGSHTIVCKLEDVPGMTDKIKQLEGKLKSICSIIETEQICNAGHWDDEFGAGSVFDEIESIAKLNQSGTK